VTDADIEKYGSTETGLPLEAFFGKLERFLEDVKHA